jgi:hypothetical protein
LPAELKTPPPGYSKSNRHTGFTFFCETGKHPEKHFPKKPDRQFPLHSNVVVMVMLFTQTCWAGMVRFKHWTVLVVFPSSQTSFDEPLVAKGQLGVL